MAKATFTTSAVIKILNHLEFGLHYGYEDELRDALPDPYGEWGFAAIPA